MISQHSLSSSVTNELSLGVCFSSGLAEKLSPFFFRSFSDTCLFLHWAPNLQSPKRANHLQMLFSSHISLSLVDISAIVFFAPAALSTFSAPDITAAVGAVAVGTR